MLFNDSLQASTKEDFIRVPKSVKDTPSHISHIHYSTFSSHGENIQDLWDVISSITTPLGEAVASRLDEVRVDSSPVR